MCGTLWMLASAGKLRIELGSRALRCPPAILARLHVFYSYTYLLTYLQARTYYGTPYMGADGRWNGANSPIDPWQHGNEGGVERGDRRI